MARSEDSDPLNVNSFAMMDIPTVSFPPVAFPLKAGESTADKNLISFASIVVPTMTIQTKKIQEGNWPYQHSVAMTSVVTGQVRIKQAVMPLNLDFFVWFTTGVNGTLGTAPRRHFIVVHTRNDKIIPARQIFLWDCIPVEWTPTSELNASSSEIAIEELVMDCNRVEVLPGLP